MFEYPERVTVRLNLGVVELSGEWEPSDSERLAAWELYVELVTRVAVAPLEANQGSLREALTSLYEIFPLTRDILRRYGPEVAVAKRRSNSLTFGQVAVNVLNLSLRPFLTRWHPLLTHWEERRSDDVSMLEHELNWPLQDSMRLELADLTTTVRQFARVLGASCDVADLTQP